MASSQNDPAMELETLMNDLNGASKSFNPSHDLEGYKSRVKIISKAKELINAMTDPSDMAYSHCSNVSLSLCHNYHLTTD